MGDNNFSHDERQGCTNEKCSGYGCDCDEKKYGYRGRGNNGGNGVTVAFLILFVVACVIGVWNEIIGALVVIVGSFLIWINR